MPRSRAIALVIVGLVLAFLIGFLPPWSRTRTLSGELAETRQELELARLEGRLGAALAEAQRSNYERARQLMAGFFTGVQQELPRVTDARQHQELQQILTQRDEIITLLSRAEPESTQRLMLLYTRYFAAIDPAGRETPTALTPSTP